MADSVLFTLGGEDSNPQHSGPKPDVLPVELSPTSVHRCSSTPPGTVGELRYGTENSVGALVAHPEAQVASPAAMGSLIKKRRKRMRKKKHKKMLKRTRFQRRAKK